jgi:hypothetical protein
MLNNSFLIYLYNYILAKLNNIKYNFSWIKVLITSNSIYLKKGSYKIIKICPKIK